MPVEFQYLKRLSLFSNIDDADLEILSRDVTKVTLSKGAALFHAGDPAHFAYLVCYGHLKMVKRSPEGCCSIIRFFGRGEIIGALLGGRDRKVYPVNCISMDKTLVFQIPMEEFKKDWFSHPLLGERIQEQIQERMAELQIDKLMAVQSPACRLASFILRSLEKQSFKDADRLMINLTRQEMAERIGTTVETVIRILAIWRRNGWVLSSNQRIEVLRKDSLREIACF